MRNGVDSVSVPSVSSNVFYYFFIKVNSENSKNSGFTCTKLQWDHRQSKRVVLLHIHWKYM